MTNRQWQVVCILMALGSIGWGASLMELSLRNWFAAVLLMFGGMWLEDFRQRTTAIKPGVT